MNHHPILMHASDKNEGRSKNAMLYVQSLEKNGPRQRFFLHGDV